MPPEAAVYFYRISRIPHSGSSVNYIVVNTWLTFRRSSKKVDFGSAKNVFLSINY